MDLAPDIKARVNGKIIYRKSELERGPGKCFAENHLYSSRRFPTIDALERFLFGPLDDFGAKGLKIIEDNSWEQHGTDCVTWTIEFFDALKLRTPKGLDWLFSQALQSTELSDAIWSAAQSFQAAKREISLISLQRLRQINLTTWWEAVWEIVSSEDSKTKFIFSDHPVTVYNPEFFPLAPHMSYPNEPSILLRGTRTLIPLSLHSCLIITNLEYAREPGRKISAPRTNARYFGQPKLFDIRSIIRGRKLSSTEVAAINFIIKRRAKRYIAAANPEWLYPEKDMKTQHWSKLDSILLPNKDEVAFYHGGEFFWGNNKYFTGADEFGRPMSKQKIDEAIKSHAKIKELVKAGRKDKTD